MDLTLNVPTLVTLGLAIIGGIVWLVRLEGKTDTNSRDNATLNETLGAVKALVDLHHQQFNEYRIKAAEMYVTQSAVSDIKRDLIEEMNKMERRVEQAIDRAFKSTQGGK
jgi:hypothetical protein